MLTNIISTTLTVVLVRKAPSLPLRLTRLKVITVFSVTQHSFRFPSFCIDVIQEVTGELFISKVGCTSLSGRQLVAYNTVEVIQLYERMQLAVFLLAILTSYCAFLNLFVYVKSVFSLF